MRLLKTIIIITTLAFGVGPAAARDGLGGFGGDSCQMCNKMVGEDWVVYRCLDAKYAGRKGCAVTRAPYGCQESGDYCGFFFPSPNPVIT